MIQVTNFQLQNMLLLITYYFFIAKISKLCHLTKNPPSTFLNKAITQSKSFGTFWSVISMKQNNLRDVLVTVHADLK